MISRATFVPIKTTIEQDRPEDVALGSVSKPLIEATPKIKVEFEVFSDGHVFTYEGEVADITLTRRPATQSERVLAARVAIEYADHDLREGRL